LGRNVAECVIAANTVHLIPNIRDTFKGIYNSLCEGGTFVFQSGNIRRPKRKAGTLMIDHTIDSVHDLAIETIKTNNRFKKYRKGLSQRVAREIQQRKFVFPTPRPLEYYLKALRSAGFKNETVLIKRIKVRYKDWLSFLRVRRLQAGILPEIGGIHPTKQEERDRDSIITSSALKLFEILKQKNPMADSLSFTSEWVYVSAEK
jgi:hypothetical protein